MGLKLVQYMKMYLDLQYLHWNHYQNNLVLRILVPILVQCGI